VCSFFGIEIVPCLAQESSDSRNLASNLERLVLPPPATGNDSHVFAAKSIPGAAFDSVATSVPNVSDGAPALQALEPKLDVRSESSALGNLKGLGRIVTVNFTTIVDSKSAYAGQRIQGVLDDDFVLGSIEIAPKGSVLSGQIIRSTPARTLAQSVNDGTRRFKSRGCLEVQFDLLTDPSGKQIPVAGNLVKQITVMPGQARREIRVDRLGRIVKSERSFTPERQRAYNVARVATMAPVPIPGNFILTNFVGVPLALGAAGAADPSFAYNKPVDEDVTHKRLKGFTYAFLTNLPGAFWVQAIVEKGNEVVLNPGDQIAVNLTIASPKSEPNKEAQEKIAVSASGLINQNIGPPNISERCGTRLLPYLEQNAAHLLPAQIEVVGNKKVHGELLGSDGEGTQ